MKHVVTRWLLGALFVVPTLAQAQSAQKFRPGLWEHSFSMQSQGGQIESAMQQMQQSMASLPPEQRKMMEEMMAKQGVGLGAGGNSVKVCLSREDAERDLPPQQKGCTQDVKRSGNVWQVAFQCKGPPPSSGEGRMTLLSPTAYTGNFDILTEVANKPERIRMSNSGKWLGADCGQIRPTAR